MQEAVPSGQAFIAHRIARQPYLFSPVPHSRKPPKYKAQRASLTKEIKILYDGGGRKLQKRVIEENGTLVYQQDYVSGIEYRTTPTKALTLEAIPHTEGRVYNTNVTSASTTLSLRYEYTKKDHLGNARLSFTDKNANGVVDVTNTAANEVLQENHYYS